MATESEKAKESIHALGIKGTAERVFIYLLEAGVSPVSKISDAPHIPKASIYDALGELQNERLVIEYSENRSKEYGPVSDSQLKDLIASKISSIKNAETALLSLMALGHKEGPTKPKIKFYTGKEGIRQAFRDTMWHEKCKETFLMWPTNEMIDILTPEFSKWHSEQRLRYKVHMYIIRKHSDRKLDKESEEKHMLLQSDGWKNDRDVRYAPKETEWSMSFWVYDDKCLFASSTGEQFAFIVQSREFAHLMKLLWKNTWAVSTE
ncbi:MAG: TrmB family transcriptional regulator [Candidatus Taylorbacteria bacterium]|nr:TrmB family transcriptional regulator [Candidatus Taylorbacteria bacterium]